MDLEGRSRDTAHYEETRSASLISYMSWWNQLVKHFEIHLALEVMNVASSKVLI